MNKKTPEVSAKELGDYFLHWLEMARRERPDPPGKPARTNRSWDFV